MQTRGHFFWVDLTLGIGFKDPEWNYSTQRYVRLIIKPMEVMLLC